MSWYHLGQGNDPLPCFQWSDNSLNIFDFIINETCLHCVPNLGLLTVWQTWHLTIRLVPLKRITYEDTWILRSVLLVILTYTLTAYTKRAAHDIFSIQFFIHFDISQQKLPRLSCIITVLTIKYLWFHYKIRYNRCSFIIKFVWKYLLKILEYMVMYI